MNKLFIIVLSVLVIVTAGTTVYFSSKSKDLKKVLIRKEFEKDDLQEELDESKSKIKELKDELANVNHFDKWGINSNSSSGKFYYTGDLMESQIDGDFEGWDGNTIFKMMNGTIWQQVSYDYTYHYAFMPTVIIYKKSGAYYMKVEGVDKEIKVRRL